MNSKERVLAAITHQQPDRIPLDFWWSNETKVRLLRYLNLRDVDELQSFLGSDIRGVYPTYIGPELRRFDDGSYEDFWGVVRTPFAHGLGGEYDEVITPPLANATSLDDIHSIRWPDPDWFDYGAIPEICKQYPDMAIAAGNLGVQDFINGVAFPAYPVCFTSVPMFRTCISASGTPIKPARLITPARTVPSPFSLGETNCHNNE